jgi:hypothetical protein
VIVKHSLPAMDLLLDELTGLRPDTYTHLVIVFTRPPQGLGALVAGLMLIELSVPTFSSYNVLRARVLARTDTGAVHEWVLHADGNGFFLRMSENDFIGEVPVRSMRVRGAGLLVAHAQWATGPGWVLRRCLRDWDMVVKA